jgi:hypothetical protein
MATPPRIILPLFRVRVYTINNTGSACRNSAAPPSRGGIVTMQAHVQAVPATDSAPIYRHICGWCRRDLGALWHGSQHHSYAICDTCKQTYFAGLYDATALAYYTPEKASSRS